VSHDAQIPPGHGHLDVLGEVFAALVEVFGTEPDRASVSFVGVEPIEVLRFDTGALVTLVTLGMARRAMTASDSMVLTEEGPRAELLLQLRGHAGEAWQRLAVLAAAPVVEGVVYSSGMTVDLGTPLNAQSRCTGGVVVESAVPSISTSIGSVDVLRVLPATSSELAWARVRGSAALTERWDERGTELLDLLRAEVELD
jgi:hypothetical protein